MADSGSEAKAFKLERRHPSEGKRGRAELEAELDEALLGTFPASDLPSVTSTTVSGGPPQRDRF